MKRSAPILLILLTFFSSCSISQKAQLYNKFKNEIVKNIFVEFEKYLPASFDSSLLSEIRYAPSYKAFGCSGIDILYNSKGFDFDKSVKELYSKNKVSNNLSYDSLNLNRSNSEYYSFSQNNLPKIAIPRVKNDFCRTNDTCFSWDDLDVVILEIGKKRVFSKNVSSEYQPRDPICNYSIGALISRRKKQIIYWLFIYK